MDEVLSSVPNIGRKRGVEQTALRYLPDQEPMPVHWAFPIIDKDPISRADESYSLSPSLVHVL